MLAGIAAFLSIGRASLAGVKATLGFVNGTRPFTGISHIGPLTGISDIGDAEVCVATNDVGADVFRGVLRVPSKR